MRAPQLRLSLLIPTKNRPGFLARLLRYYADHALPSAILIGDASDPEEFLQNEEVICGYQNRLMIRHYRHAPETLPYESLVQLLREARTPYSVFSGDDDYFVPKQLQRCVDFLETHRDYNAACGVSAWVYVNFLPTGALQVWQIRAGTHAGIEHPQASARMLAYVCPMRMNSFVVQRTQAMRSVHESTLQLGLATDHFHQPLCELAVTLGIVIQGKQACLPGLYHVMVRHTNKPGFSRPTDTFQRLTHWNWSSEIMPLLRSWATELIQREDLAFEQAARVAETCFLHWLLPLLSRHHQVRLREMGSAPKPPWGAQPLRSYLGRLPGVRIVRRLVAGTPELSLKAFLSPRSPYHRDFLPIYDLLRLPDSAIQGEPPVGFHEGLPAVSLQPPIVG